jgi:ribosomal protein L22
VYLAWLSQIKVRILSLSPKKKYIIMEEISKMSLADKIIILNEVKKNFSILKKTWTTAKVQWLDVHVLAELQKLGDFKY